MASQDSLAYHEPGITTVLIQAGFLLALNMVNTVLDKIIYCGLIGQLFIGMAWGIPGGNLLELNVQKSIQQLGYLGLLLLVYEGESREANQGEGANKCRWSINFLLSTEVKLWFFCSGCHHRSRCPHGPLFRSDASTCCNAPAGLCCRCSAMFNQYRHYVHHSIHYWAF